MTEHSQTSINHLSPGEASPADSVDSTRDDSVFRNPILGNVREALDTSESINDLVRKMAVVVCQNTQCLALWFAQRDSSDAPWQLHAVSDENSSAVSDIAGERLIDVLNTAKRASTVCSLAMEPNHSIVGASVEPTAMEQQMALVGVFSSQTQSGLRQQWMVSIAVQAIGQWVQKRGLVQAASSQKLLADSLNLVASMNQSSSRQEAANNLVNQLRKLLAVSQVVWCEGKAIDKAKLVAVSEVEKFDPWSESSRITTAAAARAIAGDEPLVLDEHRRPEPTDALAMEAYCKANRFSSCVCVGVRDRDGRACGSLLVASDKATLSEHQVSQIQQFASLNGLHLHVVQRANLSMSEFVGERVSAVPGKKWFRAAMLVAAATVGLLLIPMPYRVGCECEIQPSIRRFVAAPYQGALEEAFVSPGEAVVKDQVIAMMDGRQLRHELTGLQAEYNAARKRGDSALAQGEVAQSQIARSEMRGLDSRIQSLADQLGRLEIRSPYDGIIISGDLKKAEGAPMEMGQTLFEVAPANAMLAEISIPESEIQYVDDDNKVDIKLNAFPFQTFSGQIRAIHPVAEIINDESVFVAEVDLSNTGIAIRPGMKGSAKVSTFWRPLGWNLFHNAWETVRCWTVW